MSDKCQTVFSSLSLFVATFAEKIKRSMMQQTTFTKFNTLMAWLSFAIAAIVYGLTIEPTASLWDCPEFIACGYKLEIGHPPGAPFFMLVANLFAQFAVSHHYASGQETDLSG